ncbi:hypothetical protein F5887DRAFT_1288897 [Amanita rubescens]|nr:hypothetical protein F5887DRAFT_1288897 [Amanita rubescens]
MSDDDDYSDLTDIDNDEYGPSPSKKKSSKSNSSASAAGGFRVKNALKVPRPTTYTVQALYDQIHGSDINLEPDYQRDVVWPEGKQIGIIDSVFRNFYIPPVIFAVNTFDDGSETRTCIDGKQRLTSVYRFMDGLIPHKDPFTGEKLWYKDVGQKTKSSKRKTILPEKYRRLFANKQIVCVEYHDINDQDEREIFQRVQLGMALTPAEKLQVINSPRAQFIRELQANYLKEQGGGLTTSALDWDRSRGSDFRGLAQAIYTIDKYSPAYKTSPTILQIEKWLSDDSTVTTSFRNKIKDTFDIFVLLVHDKATKSAFKKPTKVSPVEFILIVVLIAVWKDKMSLAELSESIAKMREDVRMYHTDIRMNSKVTKTMVDFMRGLKASKTAPDQTAAAVAKSKPAPNSTVPKRKRGRDEMDVDGETNNDTDLSDSSEEEQQQSKKVKRSPPTAPTTSAASPPKSLPNLRPTLTSGPVGPPRPTAPLPAPVQSQPPTPSQSAPPLPPPPLKSPTTTQAPPTQPKMDRLAGLRAARAAAAQSYPSLPLAPRSVGTNGNSSNGPPPSPRSPSTPFPNFKGGLGMPPTSHQLPSHRPPSSNPNFIPLFLPSPTQGQHSQAPGTSMENILNASLSRGPPPPSVVGRPETDRERKEREQWEIGRYGRVQNQYSADYWKRKL